jgi:hypothetical protein
MRDRNSLSYQQFNIQLEEKVLKSLKELGTKRNSFSQEQSFEFRPDTLHEELKVFYPRNFRLLRTLSIINWYLPESISFLTKLQLEEDNFHFLNEKQRIELSILISSKENMEKYLYLTERYSGNEIFGNILGNDLKELSKKYKISRIRNPFPRRKVYRRGPKDYGSRRVISQGPLFYKDLYSDLNLLKEEEMYQRKEKLIHKTISRILIVLENYKNS